MRPIARSRALAKLRDTREEYRGRIAADFEHRAAPCSTCDTPGACCLDAHFVNVHISRLEAVAINEAIDRLSAVRRTAVRARIADAIETFGLADAGSTFSRTFACPLYEHGTGCLVHDTKPLPCIHHACYGSPADLPPDELLDAGEIAIHELNTRAFGGVQPALPLPIAINRYGST